MSSPLRTLAHTAYARQIEALTQSASALNGNFDEAAALIARARRTITAGLGKSGFIARKMAATLLSVRMPAQFLHPVEALHGDIGMVEPESVLVVFSKSGETPEILKLVAVAKQHGIPVIGITSRVQSSLAKQADISLAALITAELDSDNVLPTASTTSALVLADVLCVCAIELHGGASQRLMQSHPDGAIGSLLLRTAADVMHTGDQVPMVQQEATLHDVLVQLTVKPLGIVCVCDNQHQLRGVVTDGDVRRFVLEHDDLRTTLVSDVMTKQPVTVCTDDTLHHVLQVMEGGSRQISAVPVVDRSTCVGVVRLHDIASLQLQS